MLRLTIISFFVLSTFPYSFAQEIIETRGEAKGKTNSSISVDDLKAQLLDQAKINAIANAFGTYVERTTFIDIKDGQTYFNIEGETVVKGEWLKTTYSKCFEERVKVKKGRKKEYETWISCSIEGMVREVTNPAISFEAIPLNCPDKLCRTEEFLNGESLYLYFNAAIDGYLSIYAVEEDKALRLVPYQYMPSRYLNAVPVKADVPYILFSPDKQHGHFEEFNQELVDELVMITDKKQEIMDLYIVYSKNQFLKPQLNEVASTESNGWLMPKSLAFNSFEDWLQDNRIHSTDFYYKKMTVRISK